eukprot:scaffold27324_cov63-Cyclotella_meneghiniana.AAC.2
MSPAAVVWMAWNTKLQPWPCWFEKPATSKNFYDQIQMSHSHYHVVGDPCRHKTQIQSGILASFDTFIMRDWDSPTVVVWIKFTDLVYC